MSVGGPITLDNIVSVQGSPGLADAESDPISESTFFYQLTLLLERDFVDPVEQNEDLAVGAVRGMVNSLADSNSLFYKREQMSALKARRSGVFVGIGVEVRLKYDEAELTKLQNLLLGIGGADGGVNYDPNLLRPSVVISTVVGGSPADKAGLQVGDRITRINGKWAFSSLDFLEQREFEEQLEAETMTADELQAIRVEYIDRVENSISPMRASDLLMLGTGGEVEIEWYGADGGHGSATVQRSKSKVPAVTNSGGVFNVRFFKNVVEELAGVEWPDGPVTIDLRQSTMGDYGSMRECLGLFGGQGSYGVIVRSQAGGQRRLQATGEPFGRELLLIVDESTWGAAAVFASALVSAGKAEIVEGTLTADLPWVELFQLPGGSGYTLKTGSFSPDEEGAQ